MTLKCEICGEKALYTMRDEEMLQGVSPLLREGRRTRGFARWYGVMVFCSTHSSERWLQKRRETCSLPIESALNDAYLTGGSVFWGIQNAAVSQSTQLFAMRTVATTTEITTDLANGRHEKALVNTGDGSRC